MRNVGDSWVVTTSFLLRPDGPESLPEVEVSIVSAQNSRLRSDDQALVLPNFGGPSSDSGSMALRTIGNPSSPAGGGVIFDFASFDRGRATSAAAALGRYAEAIVGNSGSNSTPAAGSRLVADLRRQALVPQFGSAPGGWTSLQSAVTGALSSGVVYFKEGEPVFVLLTGVAMTVFLRIALPAADGVGEGLKGALQESVEARTRRLLKLPPKDDAGSEDGDAQEKAADAVDRRPAQADLEADADG